MYVALCNVLDLLTALRGSWPYRSSLGAAAGSQSSTSELPPSPATAAMRAQVASIPADSTDEVVVQIRNYMLQLAGVQDVCDVAAQCARACSSVQLLGCAHLGCTLVITPPPGGLGSCEAALGVNRKGSVCGGCGVVRYCSAACAQQDWPGHRRVCRRLAAALVAQRDRR
jgi:hypothetical protein